MKTRVKWTIGVAITVAIAFALTILVLYHKIEIWRYGEVLSISSVEEVVKEDNGVFDDVYKIVISSDYDYDDPLQVSSKCFEIPEDDLEIYSVNCSPALIRIRETVHYESGRIRTYVYYKLWIPESFEISED